MKTSKTALLVAALTLVVALGGYAQTQVSTTPGTCWSKCAADLPICDAEQVDAGTAPEPGESCYERAQRCVQRCQ